MIKEAKSYSKMAFVWETTALKRSVLVFPLSLLPCRPLGPASLHDSLHPYPVFGTMLLCFLHNFYHLLNSHLFVGVPINYLCLHRNISPLRGFGSLILHYIPGAQIHLAHDK